MPLQKGGFFMSGDALRTFRGAAEAMRFNKHRLDEKSEGLLHAAIVEGDIATVRALLNDKEFRATTRKAYFAQETLNRHLLTAMKERQKDIVIMLVEAGAKPNGVYGHYRDAEYFISHVKLPEDMRALAVRHSRVVTKVAKAFADTVPAVVAAFLPTSVLKRTSPTP
jgi:hypothetical protein